MRNELSLPRWSRRSTPIVLAVACAAVCSVAFSPMSAEANPAGAFSIAVWTFDRGNAKVFANPDIYADYRDKFPELVVGDGRRAAPQRVHQRHRNRLDRRSG